MEKPLSYSINFTFTKHELYVEEVDVLSARSECFAGIILTTCYYDINFSSEETA